MSVFSDHILINASRARVWEVLSAPNFASQWAGVFGDDAPNFSGEWKEGGELRCWTENGDGLVSRIVRCMPEKIAEFEHVAGLAKGEKCELADDAEEWKGLRELFALSDELITDDGTLLTDEGVPISDASKCVLSVWSEAPGSMSIFFMEKWPLVLQKIKELSEARGGN